jgi:putative spermidine/putrescine transport system substrate-binding protein
MYKCIIAMLSILAAFPLTAGHARAADDQVVVIGSWGGTYETLRKKAIFEPFTNETGIKIILTPMPTLAKVQAMVESGSVTVDILEGVDRKDVVVLERRGLLEKINYDLFSPETLSTLPKEAMDPYAVGQFIYGLAIAYNTKNYSADHHPTSWKDLWDTERFPGERTLPDASFPVGPLEMALLADGVAADKLYPLDVDRAFKSLDRIKSHVVKWWKGSPEGAQLILDGHAELGSLPIARAASMIQAAGANAPMALDYNQALVKTDFEIVPKGAKNAANAMKFIAYISQPKNVAAFINAYPLNGAVNPKALTYVDPKLLPTLITSAANASKLIHVSDDWWAAIDDSGKSNFEKVLERWNEWVGK